MDAILHYLNLDRATAIGVLLFAAVFLLPIIPALLVARWRARHQSDEAELPRLE